MSGAHRTAWRRAWTDLDIVVVVAGLVAGTVAGTVARRAGLAVALGVSLGARRRIAVAALAVVMCLVGAGRSDAAWRAVTTPRLGSVTGFVEVAADAVPVGRGVRVTVVVDGQRFDAWAFGKSARRVGPLQVGDRIWVSGRRRPLSAAGQRARLRHVVGVVEVQSWGDVVTGSPASVSAERVRRLVRTSAEVTMDPDDAALFSGLVLGDDARQSPVMVSDFRRSGLSHLTAVSGQNITLLLALVGPMLRRLRPLARLAATVALIAWLAVVTRLEPSVLRAGLMAGLGAVAFAAGRQATAIRLLALSVGVVVLADPLLVRSIGLWLSVGATAGVIVVAPRLAPGLPGPDWMRTAASVTLGAQIGVAVPSLVAFGRLPVVAPLANLLAVPVAAVVMTAGVPCAVAANLLGRFGSLRRLVMAPMLAGCGWVRHVAALASRVEPGPAVGGVLWVAVLVAVVWRAGRVGRARPDGDVAA